MSYKIPKLPLAIDLETKAVLRQLNSANRKLAELTYTKTSFVQELLQVSRLTATQYLKKIVAAGLLKKVKSGRNNYYLNLPLCELFINAVAFRKDNNDMIIESANEK